MPDSIEGPLPATVDSLRVTVRVEPIAKNELPGIAHGVVQAERVGTTLDIARALLADLTEDLVTKLSQEVERLEAELVSLRNEYTLIPKNLREGSSVISADYWDDVDEAMMER